MFIGKGWLISLKILQSDSAFFSMQQKTKNKKSLKKFGGLMSRIDYMYVIYLCKNQKNNVGNSRFAVLCLVYRCWWLHEKVKRRKPVVAAKINSWMRRLILLKNQASLPHYWAACLPAWEVKAKIIMELQVMSFAID